MKSLGEKRTDYPREGITVVVLSRCCSCLFTMLKTLIPQKKWINHLLLRLVCLNLFLFHFLGRNCSFIALVRNRLSIINTSVFLFQILRMFSKMKGGERNAALKVMLVRRPSFRWNIYFYNTSSVFVKLRFSHWVTLLIWTATDFIPSRHLSIPVCACSAWKLACQIGIAEAGVFRGNRWLGRNGGHR